MQSHCNRYFLFRNTPYLTYKKHNKRYLKKIIKKNIKGYIPINKNSRYIILISNHIIYHNINVSSFNISTGQYNFHQFMLSMINSESF